MTRAIMMQGAGSNVGKSLFVAGLARVYARQGLSVAPFKPQNMSNNAAVAEGGEIGRAQALQARAAGRTPHVDMNPVLLKPETDIGAQVIVQGQRFATLAARDYGAQKATLLPRVLKSFHRLATGADLILVEGAGSPAETNLRAGDIANMGFAEAAVIPVILLGDIDRGGVIAQLVGTHAVLSDADKARIKGFVVNKFRGDVKLFDGGRDTISDHTGWPSLGTLPWFADAWRLPAEDILDLRSSPGGQLKIAVPKLARIANFDDLDPLASEPNVTIDIVEAGRALPGDAALVLIPGSKSTIADLRAFRANGWDIDLQAHLRRGGHVLGICGGYQMLGQSITDPEGIESDAATEPGLGLLQVETVMQPEKRVTEVSGIDITSNTAVSGYEIHIGQTKGTDCARGWLQIGDRTEGAMSADGKVMGCYMHGLFGSDAFRAHFLEKLGGQSALADFDQNVEATLNALADHIETHIDTDALLAISTDV